jgi:AraC-type DNA-binding domain-containing proteins
MKVLDNGNLTDSLEPHTFQKYRHWHEQVELVFVKRGELLLEIAQDRISLQRGMVFVIAANVPHTFLEVTLESELYVVKVKIDRIWHDQNDYCDSIVGESAFAKKADENLRAYFEEMMFVDYGDFTDLYATGKAFEIFSYIYGGRSPHIIKIKANTIESSNLVFRIREYFIKNMKEDISLTSLAEYLGISTSYCSKIIKGKTTLSFSEYLNFIRLDAAENLLVNTDTKIIEICYEAGFRSIQSFNRNFKKYEGISPSKYRERYQKQKQDSRKGQLR